MKKAFCFGIYFLLVLTACKESISYKSYQGQAQGTTYSIVVHSNTNYKKRIDSLLKAVDQSMSLWVPNSTINRLNASKSGVLLEKEFKQVVEEALAIHHETDGALDITIGPIIKKWGFIRKNGLPIPPDDTLLLAKRHTGVHLFEFKGDTLFKKDPPAEMDVNAIAQGFSVDLLAKLFEADGVEDYMIELGGEVRAKGVNSRGEIWKIGIEKPDYNLSENRNDIQEVIALKDRSLVTSGSYRKFIEVDGKKYSHTIDPKTAKPVGHQLLSVTVIAPKCSRADGLATAFMVLGKDKTLQMAPSLNVEVFCIYDSSGIIKTAESAGMARLKLP